MSNRKYSKSPKSRAAASPAPAPLSGRKRFVFRLVAASLPLLLVALAEISLRFCGFGGYAPMFRKLGPVSGGNLVMAVQGGAASWFFANPGRAGTSEQYTFIDPKPTNTVRVMLLGESAMQGYPQPRHLSSSAFLQEMLGDVWRDRRVEVINLGTTAVASFPILGILKEALEYQPDLVVLYLGHNEFFGTYGVASVGHAGARPWLLRAHRWLHSLALVQALQSLQHRGNSEQGRTFMEEMMAQTYIGPKDSLRNAAANLLYRDVKEMIEKCQARGARVLVCLPPSNERDLAPIGRDLLEPLEPDSEMSVAALGALVNRIPTHSRGHYLLGRVFSEQGKHKEARDQYVLARDLDTMPWRAPSQSINAILRAARERSVPVCDLPQTFRAESPGGSIGWELMDDHVHPTLRGQAVIAESILDCLTNFDGGLRISAQSRARLPGWEVYSQRLGDNIYDRYAVAHNMRLVFSAQFMRRNNDAACRRFNEQAEGFEQQMPPAVRAVLHEWQATKPFEGSRCPATAAVAQLLLKQDHYQEAQHLFAIAQRAVPQYSSWYLEYVYYDLLCRQKLSGKLDEPAQRLAHSASEQGHFLAEHVKSDTDFTLRYTGFLHFLCGEFREAIPCLLAVQPQQTGIDRLALDQALVICYLETRQGAKAQQVLAAGAAAAGEYSQQYKSMQAQLTELQNTTTQRTNAPAR